MQDKADAKVKEGIREDKIRRTHHGALFHMIKDRMESFAFRNGVTLTDVHFQCDSDCENFIHDIGLKTDQEGSAYVIADHIAGANNVGLEPRGVFSLDLVSELSDELLRKLRR